MLEHSEFEARILAFEQAWKLDPPPEIGDYVGARPVEEHQLLRELICIDLEFRWRKAARDSHGTPRGVDDYLRQFPELACDGNPPDELIVEEYRVRHRWGDRPALADFLCRFPNSRDELLPALRAVDHELQLEEPASEVESKLADPPSLLARIRTPLAYGDYLLQEMIGAGRTGRVYRAWQNNLERMVAVKFLRKTFLSQGQAVERFLTEARVIARFQHPGIIHVHGVGSTPRGGYFIVMEWIEQGDLMRQLAQGPVPVGRAVPWIVQVARTLQHVHKQGFIHCDLKPANLLLDRQDHVRITDFGMARSAAGSAHLSGIVEGTPAFMAPEQVSPVWGPIDPRTDIYGLGAVLLMLLTGRPPVRATSVAEILSELASPAETLLPVDSWGRIPPAISQVCLRALAKAPTDRFGTMHEFESALAGAFSQGPRPRLPPILR